MRDEDGETRDLEKRKPTLTLRRTHFLSLTRARAVPHEQVSADRSRFPSHRASFLVGEDVGELPEGEGL